MNDENSLKLLAEILENVKKSTNTRPYAFYHIFRDFVADITHLTDNVLNDNLRVFALHVYLLSQAPAKTYFDHSFQDSVTKKLKESFEKEREVREDIIVNLAHNSLSIEALSDLDGTETIDMNRLRRDLENNLEGLDESTKIFALLKITNAIRKIFNTDFVEEKNREILKFYDNLIEGCKKGWPMIYDVLFEYLAKWDRKARFVEAEGDDL